ncbi:MAG TPA: S4 domain-containing protein [Caulobacteraceae bacterium]
MAEETCRLDVWLWRARFFKTRAMAAQVVGAGAIRLTRAGAQERVSRPAKTLHRGDELVFAFAGRLREVRVEAFGRRRGPPTEARALYSPLEDS